MEISRDALVIKRAAPVCRVLCDNGYEAVLVGGSVRDLILGQNSNDCDIATNAHPDKVEELFETTLAIGKAYGTITVCIDEDGIQQQIQVTTYRSESTYSNKRHPDQIVFETELIEDVKRRDFTCNALAYDPLTHNLHDYVGGVTDIAAKCLRVVGEPSARFAEDSLRLWRCCRFIAQLGFQPDPQSWKALCDAVSKINLPSKERITYELQRLMASKTPSAGLIALVKSGLADHSIPGLQRLAEEDFQHCDAQPVNARWAWLLDQLDVEAVFGYLRFSSEQKKWIRAMIAVGGDEKKARFSIHDLAVSGQELKDRGYSGPQIGQAQQAMKAYVLEDLSRNTSSTLWTFLNAL